LALCPWDLSFGSWEFVFRLSSFVIRPFHLPPSYVFRRPSSFVILARVSFLRRLTPLLTTFAIALVVSQPLFRGYLLCTDDGYYHINKAVELELVMRAGHFFGRWMPGMAHGFGYPHFNYYAPLASYVLIALHNLGLIYPIAFNFFLFICIWLAGLGTYYFVKDWWGEAGALAAAAVYMTAPYLGFDVMVRGALAETFALVWPPIILFTLRRALTSPAPSSTHYTLLATLSFAALMYAHNATALAVTPLILGYIALLALMLLPSSFVFRPSSFVRPLSSLLRLLGILALGLALSARFWLVALVERSLVQSDRLLVPPIFTYYTNFLSLHELLAPPTIIDPLLINPSPAKGLGLVAFTLALLGFAVGCWSLVAGDWRLVVGFRRSSREAVARSSSSVLRPSSFVPSSFILHPSLFFFLALLAYMFLTLPLSRPIWDHVPLIPFIQFPWRLLGAASLCAAFLAGAAVHWLPKHQWLIGATIILTATLGHLSWWYGRDCDKWQEITQAQTVRFEIATNTIGTTAKGEFLPTTVHRMPDDYSIAESLMRGEQPHYLTGLPKGAQIAITNPDVLDYRATITTSTPFILTFNQFYFPGWRATLDKQPLEIVLTPDTGLMLVTIPSGTHTLHFHFGDTPIRAIGDSISLATLIGILIIILSFVLRPSSFVRPPSSILRPPAFVFHPSSFILPTSLFLLALLRLLVIDRTINPLRHSAFDGQTVATAQTPLRADFDGGVSLYGYDLAPRASTFPADGALDVSLYVSVSQSLGPRYWPAFRIIDEAGLLWNEPNALPPRWHKEPPPTSLWSPAQYGQWARHLQLFPGTPPGSYQLFGEVFDVDTKQIAALLDEQGNAIAPRFSLGALTVTRPTQPFVLQPEIAAPHNFGPITLLGYNLSSTEAKSGDTILLTLYWKSETATQTDYTARLDWLTSTPSPSPSPIGDFTDGGGAGVGVDLPPVNLYPTSRWQPGDEWRGQQRLQIPAALASGDYQLSISINGEEGTQSLGKIKVDAPEHNFTRPPVDFESGALFEGVGVLEGYSLRREAGALLVTLIWHATDSPTASYTAFVHLADESGRVWAQNDSVPVNWSRPTTGWVAGEYIPDEHALTLPNDLPPGGYTLFIGLYDPQTGNRVPVAGPGSGADKRVNIGTVSFP
jgi:hypothetical protein